MAMRRMPQNAGVLTAVNEYENGDRRAYGGEHKKIRPAKVSVEFRVGSGDLDILDSSAEEADSSWRKSGLKWLYLS